MNDTPERDPRIYFAAERTFLARLNRGEPFVGRPTWLGGMLAALLVVIGLLMTIYLFAAA